jgi:hypothetical protein
VKAAAAVLGASMLFFLGVLTGIGRRESVPAPSAIPLGVIDTPAASGTSTSTSPSGAPEGGSKRTTTTTTAEAPPATAAPTGVTSTTSAVSTTSPTTAPTTTGTSGPGQVQQVDNQVDCRSSGKRGKGQRQPCPSTTSSTAEAPGGGRNR